MEDRTEELTTTESQSEALKEPPLMSLSVDAYSGLTGYRVDAYSGLTGYLVDPTEVVEYLPIPDGTLTVIELDKSTNQWVPVTTD